MMNPIREHRLIRLLDSSFKDQTVYNSRIAEANASAQDQQHAQQLVHNGVSGGTTPGAVAAGGRIIAATQPQPLTEGQGKFQTATPAGQLAEARGITGNNSMTYDTATGQMTQTPVGVIAQDRLSRQQREGATPEQIAQNQQNLKGIMDPGYGVTSQQRIDTFNLDQQINDLRNSKGASPEADLINHQKLTELMKQKQIEQDTQQSAQDSAKQKAKDLPQDQQQAPPPNPHAAGAAAAFANLPPEAQFLAPFLQQFQETMNQSLTENSDMTKTLLDKNKSTHDDINSQLSAMQEGYKASTEAIQGILQDAKEQNDKQIAEQKQAEAERLEWDRQKQERSIAKQKVADHDSMVVQIALDGGFAQDAGLREVRESDAAYEGKLSDLAAGYSMARTELNAKFTGLYIQNNNDYVAKTVGNMKDLQGSLERIGMQGIANDQARATAEKDILTKGWEHQVSLRQELATQNLNVANEIQTVINQSRDDKRAQEQLGWQRLENVVRAYGSYAPEGLLDSIGKQLPGVDVRGVASQMTLAEMKQFKIKSSGGTSGGAGSYVPGEAGVAKQFAGVSANDLRGAVDRITKDFGGTGEERNRKRSEYLSRIDSGENPDSIVASMQTDYWASQKGAEKTRHDTRLLTQGSAESLQSYIDYYGISGDQDGPLGFMDSKIQGFGSWFGLSSEEYNNLAAEVGTIRGHLVKENYGSAVSQQELSLARTYIPSMSDKGAQFVSKVQNLKQYNAYLDAKQFAADVGLPQPKPPLPVSFSGNAIAGPGKYSPEDINSALQD